VSRPYFSIAWRARTAAFKAGRLTLLGVMQIASTKKIESSTLWLLMVTDQKSGTDPDAPQSELVTLTAGSIGGVKLPPPGHDHSLGADRDLGHQLTGW
jgi:hypothetical protein